MREDGVKCVAGMILSSYVLAKLRILKWLDIIYSTILIFTCMTQFVGLESGWLWLSRVSQTYLDYLVQVLNIQLMQLNLAYV